jgi:hypothetical protein
MILALQIVDYAFAGVHICAAKAYFQSDRAIDASQTLACEPARGRPRGGS